MNLAFVVLQRKVNARMRERQPGHRLAGVSHVGLRGAHELSPHRRVVKQIANLDRRADRTAANGDVAEPATVDFGRSITSPAAILLITLAESWRMSLIESVRGENV